MTNPDHDRFLAEILAQPAALHRAGAGLVEQVAALEALAAAVARAGVPAGAGATGVGEPGTGAVAGAGAPMAGAVAGAGAPGAGSAFRRPLVLLTGMGGSLDGCRAILPQLAAGGVAAFAVETAELVHARQGLLALADVVVLVSQSGRSAEALRLVDVLGDAEPLSNADAQELADRERAGGPVLCLVTNLAPNPVAARMSIVLETRAGHEEAPSTMSYTASIVTLGAVAAVLGRADPAGAAAEAAGIAEAAAVAVEALLVDHEAIAQEWRAWLGARRTLFVLGRGRSASVAGMSALLFKEATLVHAEAMSGPTFRHGPLEQAGPDAAVAIVALDPATTALDAELATDLCDAGSPVAWIGPPGTAPKGVLACPVPPLAGPAAVIPAAVPLQLLAWRLARERGAPGAFRVGGKVTTKE